MSSDIPDAKRGSKLPSRKSIPPFEALRAFDAVARLGGVRKAAKALHRDHAVISRHLRIIEDWTGTQLIERTPSGAVLTVPGHAYHVHIKEAIDRIAEATISLVKNNRDHNLTIWCIPGFALHWLVGQISSFEEANPGLEIELRSTHEEPDFTRQEADVNIQHMPIFGSSVVLPPGVQGIEISSPPIIPVASPEYLANTEAVSQPSDMVAHQLLHEEDFDNWRIWFEKNEIEDVAELSGSKLWDGHMTLAAARQGRGIALTNPLVAAEDLAARSLLEIGSENDAFKRVYLWAYCFVARSDRWDSMPVRRFREWLLNTVSKETLKD